MAPSARFGYSAAMFRDKFVLFGGYEGAKWLNDLWEYDTEGRGGWKKITPSGKPPCIRSCPSYCMAGGRLFVLGGYDGVQRMNDFFVLDLFSYTWTELPSFGSVPSPRYFHSCCLHGSKMYVFGGYR